MPFSLSLRLFGNVLSGTVMMSLIYSLLSKFAVGWPGFLHIYFDLFSGAIQTYVFCMLTMVFTSQKMPQENKRCQSPGKPIRSQQVGGINWQHQEIIF